MSYCCNNCCGGKFKDFLNLPIAGTTENYKASAFKSNGEKLVECVRCGLVSVYPIPELSDIIGGYSNAVDTEYVSQMEYRINTFKEVLDIIKRETKLINGKLLDVGAAAGAFVKVAKDDGFDAYGIEPCGYLVRWAIEKLGLHSLSSGTIEDIDKGERYDIITMFDVLEHMVDPNNSIYLAKNLLNDNSYIVMNLPDISHWIPKLMGSRWAFYASCHLYYYTPESIKYLMEKHGFNLIYMQNHKQELSLGYLAYRFEQYNPFISRIAVKVIDVLGLSKITIKYTIGQTLYIFQKN